MIRKILLMVCVLFFVACPQAGAGWWEIVHFGWDDTELGDYSVNVKIIRLNSVVGDYWVVLGDRNEFDMDIDPRGGTYDVTVYSSGSEIFKLMFTPAGKPPAAITF